MDGAVDGPDSAVDLPGDAVGHPGRFAPGVPAEANRSPVNAHMGPDCPEQANRTMAIHLVIDVRWPTSLALAAGEGEVHLWTKADLGTAGDTLSGTARPCGVVIPALTKRSFLGGGQVQLDIPAAAWDAEEMPVLQVRGTTAGFDVGSAIAVEPLASLLGLELSDPLNDRWPEAATKSLLTVDHDADGRPGITAIPRTDPPFAAPPLDLRGVLDPDGARADEIYLAMRTVLSLRGIRDTCTSAAGLAQITHIDSLVVGCHVLDGDLCTTDQVELVAASQPRLTVESATFRMVQVPATASCEEVRAALPAR